jgi:hypothetical protein
MNTQDFVPNTPRKAFAAAAFAVTAVMSLTTASLFNGEAAQREDVATLTQTTYAEGRVTVTASRPVLTAGVKEQRSRS